MKRNLGKKSFAVIAVIAIALISFCAVSYGAFGAVKNIADITGSFCTGTVDIGVDVYTMKDGKEVIMDEGTTVDREGSVSYIPRIVNRGESCYIRAALKAETDMQQPDILKDIYGIDDGWHYISGHLYYTKPLEKGDTVDICKGFDVPEGWDYMKANELRVSVTVDAVQSRNLSADFEAEEPWGNVEITSSRVCEGNTVNTVTVSEGVTAAADAMEAAGVEKGKNIELSYVNKAAGIRIDHDDMLSYALFMPGDVYEGRFTIANDNDHEAVVMFKASCDECPLAEVMQLELDNGGAFYRGSLAGRELWEYRTIAELDAGESRDIHVKITMPMEADNAYQKKKVDITWYFALAENIAGNREEAVKTGDDISILVMVMVCILSMAAVSALWKRRIKEKK